MKTPGQIALLLLAVSWLGCSAADVERQVGADVVVGGEDAGLISDGSTVDLDMASADARAGDASAMTDSTQTDVQNAEADSGGERIDLDQGARVDAMVVVTNDMGQAPPNDAAAPPEVDAEANLSFEDRIRHTLRRFMVPRMQTDITEAEVVRQTAEYGGQVSFEAALDEALLSFLNDGSDLESPRSLAMDVRQGPCLQDDLTERVRCFLNDERASLTLVGLRGFPAENGESVAENWIFLLMAESLSDHLQWAIVDRAGERPTYNYGFN